jgi:hypothetical protein
MYERKLTATMAVGLIAIYRYNQQFPGEWVHIPTLFQQRRIVRSNDGALLRQWGLIERMPGERADGSTRVGYYRMLPRGVDWVEGRIMIPALGLYWDQRFWGTSGIDITIKDALGESFQFDELMLQEYPHLRGKEVDTDDDCGDV